MPRQDVNPAQASALLSVDAARDAVAAAARVTPRRQAPLREAISKLERARSLWKRASAQGCDRETLALATDAGRQAAAAVRAAEQLVRVEEVVEVVAAEVEGNAACSADWYDYAMDVKNALRMGRPVVTGAPSLAVHRPLTVVEQVRDFARQLVSLGVCADDAAARRELTSEITSRVAPHLASSNDVVEAFLRLSPPAEVEPAPLRFSIAT